ncbi:hypothetical protein HDG40_001621 [Paraburkholderia sp. JPY158]|uniref:Uncharacterized protein n=1 Tax=Paraburkholderia atlantica TaxID=2654982 RepID=A0A7W8V569_PARAM|nr:hypothetical protein [Paraburkholderia atlantica]
MVVDEHTVVSPCQQHAEFFECFPNSGYSLNRLSVVLRGAPSCAAGDSCIGGVDRAARKDERARREARLRRTSRHQHFDGGRTFVLRIADQQHRRGGAWCHRLSLRVKQLFGTYHVSPSG